MIAFAPDTFYELLTVLYWGTPNDDVPKKLEVKDLVHHKLLTRSKGSYMLTIGTRRYGDCTRQLLLDSATVARILGYLITLPPTSPSAPSEQLPALQPVSLRDYYNVSLVEYSGRKKIEAKMWNLNGTNRRRASKASEREEKLELAREAAEEGEGKVVAISMVLHEKGRRRRKVMELGWATWVKGGLVKVTHIKIKEFVGLRNGETVPDRRDAFAFGTSKILPFEDARKLLLAEIKSTRKHPVNVVANATQQISAVLDLPKIKPPLFDLGALFKSARHDQEISTSLTDLLKYYEVDHKPELLFNAGNNAKYLLDIFLELGRTE